MIVRRDCVPFNVTVVPAKGVPSEVEIRPLMVESAAVVAAGSSDVATSAELVPLLDQDIVTVDPVPGLVLPPPLPGLTEPLHRNV